MALSLSAGAAPLLDVPAGRNQRAVLTPEMEITLIVTPHPGDAWTRLALRTTGSASQWTAIQSLNGMRENLEKGRDVRIPLAMLKPSLRREVLAALFPADKVTAEGWRHKVVTGNDVEGESYWKLAEWFTGDGKNYAAIRSANGSSRLSTRRGDSILIPAAILEPHFRLGGGEAEPPARSKTRMAEDDPAEPAPSAPVKPVSLVATVEHPDSDVPPSLEYTTGGAEPFATYRLRSGEALYSSVAIRFTGRVHAADVNAVVDEIVKFNGIEDVARLPVGYAVRIPMRLLDDEHLPATDPRRLLADAKKRDRSKAPRVAARDLRGVHVILDAGHGGRDVGAVQGGIYEADYVYDVMCRLKAQLEKHTGARVSITTKSRGDGYAVQKKDVLERKTDHVVLTSPEYLLDNPVIGVHLRWYLANSLFRKSLSKATAPEKVVFLSLHADSLHPSLRGAMAYVPGGDYVQGTYEKKGKVYLARAEVRESPSVTTSEEDAREAEALSRDLAETIIGSFRRSKLKVHSFKPIRDNVVRDGKEWVPAIIRYNQVPTRLLLEICNLGNPDDVRLMKTAKYRESVATAIRKGLTDHFETPGEVPGGAVTAAAASR